jgi:hypothetical protein
VDSPVNRYATVYEPGNDAIIAEHPAKCSFLDAGLRRYDNIFYV